MPHFHRLCICAGILALAPIVSAQTRPKNPSPAAPWNPPEIVSPVQDKVATRSTWSFLPLEAAGIETFWKTHPNADGRGVIVLILDTGVDPTIEGLTRTSEGKQKIIDVQDVSHAGDVPYSEAERRGDELVYGGKTVLKGLSTLTLKSWAGKYYYGVLNERRFQNGLGDLNFNNRHSDEFGILIFEDAPGHFAAYLDSDGDGDLSDEKPLFNFHERFDTFTFHSADSLNADGKRLGGAVNILPEESKVSVYFDDGSHGTHVAGIAAGHDIDGQAGFNGVAPGAELVGIKFADNSLGGITVAGSMKRGLEYAARLARTGKKPVVVNMSFGIGSEIEGQSAMDKWIDSLLTATPELTFCTSAGNDGPGISSIGLPGTADRVISSGATLPDDAARDLYGMYAKEPILWDFSSRGGEVPKPDFVTPGTAVSTVPDYVGGDRYNGTSMASPYSTGCVAVLISAMKEAFADYKPDAFELRRAMQLSADHLSGETPLDEGYGMVNVPRAFELLSEWHRRGTGPIHYSIETSVPNATRKAPAAYFRNGLPAKGYRQSFEVVAEPAKAISSRTRSIGMKAFDLVSDAAWLAPVEGSVYRRGEGSLDIDVRYDDKLLTQPGLYTGRVWAFAKGARHDRRNAEFELLNTVVIPHSMSAENKYHVEVSDAHILPHGVLREFLRIPPGAKAINITVNYRSAKAIANARLFNDDGREFAQLSPKPGQSSASLFLTGEQVTPGVWELDLSQGRASLDDPEAIVNIEASTVPMDYAVEQANGTAGQNASALIRLANTGLEKLSAQGDAEIPGYETFLDTVIEKSDRLELPLISRDGEKAVEYFIEFPREDYNLFTDIACQILKPDSSAVYNNAFDLREKKFRVTFEADKNETYTFLIQGGLANPDVAHPWHVKIRERRILSSTLGVRFDTPKVVLYPGESQNFKLESNRELPALPAGYRFFGNVRLALPSDNKIQLPLRF